MKKGKRAKFQVGQVVMHCFRRGDGTIHQAYGVITRIWGSHGCDVAEQEGGIRASFNDIRPLTKLERGASRGKTDGR